MRKETRKKKLRKKKPRKKNPYKKKTHKKQFRSKNPKESSKKSPKDLPKELSKGSLKKSLKESQLPKTKKSQYTEFKEKCLLIEKLKTLPPDITEKITRDYASDIITCKIKKYNRINLLVNKLNNYINIITEIQNTYPDQDLDKEILKDLIKEIENNKKNVTEKNMDSIEKKLLEYYEEIKLIEENERQKLDEYGHGDVSLQRNLEIFLETN